MRHADRRRADGAEGWCADGARTGGRAGSGADGGRAEMRTDGCCCYDAPAAGRRRWTGAEAANLKTTAADPDGSGSIRVGAAGRWEGDNDDGCCCC